MTFNPLTREVKRGTATRRAKRVIAEAADVIERDGLAKLELGHVDGPKCVLGALNHVLTGSPHGYIKREADQRVYDDAWILLSDAVYAKHSPWGSSVIWYSDNHTKDEVVALMRKAAS